MAKKCLKSKVGTPVVGCKQNPSYSIRGAIEFGKSMPFSCLWQSVTHMVTIDIGVDSSSHVDMVSQVVDIHGSQFTKCAFIVRIQPLGIGIRSRRSAIRSPTTFICCPAVYDLSENEDDLDYRPQKSAHEQFFELALQSAYLKAAATILPILPSSGAAAANRANPFRLRDTHRDLS